MNCAYLRALWPEWWRVLFAFAVCGALMSLSLLELPVAHVERPCWEALNWFLPGLLWALLLSGRSFNVAWQILGLRLPGAGRVLLSSALLNLLMLALAVLLLASGADMARLSGTLLLGWCVGLLILTLPGHWSVLVLLVAGGLAAHYGLLGWPQTATEFWLSASAMLAVVVAAWCRLFARWQAWQPVALISDAPMQSALNAQGLPVATIEERHGNWAMSPMQRLRTVLAPDLKGIFQAYRWKVRGLFVLLLGIPAVFLIWLEPTGLMRIIVAQCLVMAGVTLMATPTRYLLAQRARASQALIAELGLLPGLPRERQWLWALCVQVLRGMLERLLAVGLLASLVAWSYDLPLVWLQGLWICLSLVLVLSLGQALHVGLLGGRRRCWQVLEYCVAGLMIASYFWLLDGRIPASIVLSLWVVMVAIACIFCLWLLQRLHRRGAPYFS